MSKHFVLPVTIATLLTGCATAPVVVAPASQVVAQPACASVRLPENPRFGPAFTDKFNGTYFNGTESVRVHRLGAHRMVIYRGGVPRDLATNDVESWLFTDACGARYHFNLPPDGPGGWLKITDPGQPTTDWHRTGYN
jgi:hypothetical protein